MQIRIYQPVILVSIVLVFSLIGCGQAVAALEPVAYYPEGGGVFSDTRVARITNGESGVKANLNIINPVFHTMVAERQDKQSRELQSESSGGPVGRGVTAQAQTPSEAVPAVPLHSKDSLTGKFLSGDTYSGDERCDMDDVKNREF